MSDLDSRALRYVDTFGQKFMTPGTVRYQLGLVVGHGLGENDPEYTIEVKAAQAKKAPTRQHHLNIRFIDGKHVPENQHIVIEAGDVVTWGGSDPATPPYLVQGKAPDGAFSSGALRRAAVFTHVFLQPGDHYWADAHGSRIGGHIRVTPVSPKTEEDLKKWMESIREASVYHIKGSQIPPETREVPLGTTVCWAVEQADGIAITDTRLIAASRVAARVGEPEPASELREPMEVERELIAVGEVEVRER